MKKIKLLAPFAAVAFAAVSGASLVSFAQDDVSVGFSCVLNDVSAGKARMTTQKTFFKEDTNIEIKNTAEANENAENSGGGDFESFYAFNVEIFSENDLPVKEGGFMTFELPVPRSMTKKTQSVAVFLTSGDNAGEIAAETVVGSDGYSKIRFTYDASFGDSASFMFAVPQNSQEDKPAAETVVTQVSNANGEQVDDQVSEKVENDTTSAPISTATPFNNAETAETEEAQAEITAAVTTTAVTTTVPATTTTAQTTSATTASTTKAFTTTSQTTAALPKAGQVISTGSTTGSQKGAPSSESSNTKGSPDTPTGTKRNPGTGVALAIIAPAAAAGCIALIRKEGRRRGRK